MAAFAQLGTAAPLRIANADLSGVSSAQSEEALGSVARDLRGLDADVILLQGVRDWAACTTLARLLKPAEYQVVVCSSFEQRPGGTGPNADRTGQEPPRQAAILAKQRGYFTWSEPWREKAAGGFTFAAISLGSQRLGFFSAMLANPADAGGISPAFEQVLTQVGSVKKWDRNRPGVFVMSGNSDVTAFLDRDIARLSGAGFQGVPAGEAAGEAGFIMVAGGEWHPEIRSLGARSSAVRGWQVTLTKPAPAPVASVPSPVPATSAAAASQSTPQRTRDNPASNGISTALASQGIGKAAPPQNPLDSRGTVVPHGEQRASAVTPLSLITGGALLLFACGTAVFLARSRAGRKRPAKLLLIPNSEPGSSLPSHNYIVVANSNSDAARGAGEPPQVIHVTPQPMSQANFSLLQEEQNSASPNLAETVRGWLKERLVRKLVEDRARLIETNTEAAHRALDVTARIDRIEQQLQQQNARYQERINELTRELEAAREESRELLRARIAQVKLEMKAAEAKLLASTREDVDR